jgi:hypothetical protein
MGRSPGICACSVLLLLAGSVSAMKAKAPPPAKAPERLYEAHKATLEDPARAAKNALDHWVDELLKVGTAHGRQDHVAKEKYLDAATDAILAGMDQGGGEYGAACRNRTTIKQTVKLAAEKGYPIHFADVRVALRNVITAKLSLDYNSTISCFKGDWRGGGFFHDDHDYGYY